jgi:hypothetical protein
MANVPNIVFVSFGVQAGNVSFPNAGARFRKSKYEPFHASNQVAIPRIPLETPDTPASPNPANSATNVGAGFSSAVGASWAISTHATSYDVWFGTVDPPPKVATKQAGTVYNYPSQLAYSTIYYWRIQAQNLDHQVLGPLWSFTTSAPTAPAVPYGENPSNTTVHVDPTIVLTWTATPGAINYDVKFGTDPTGLPTIANNLTVPLIDPGVIDFQTLYFWQVIAKNAVGNTNGPIWAFTTIVQPPPAEAPPFVITVNGLTYTGIKRGSISIRDINSFESPNECSFQVFGLPPTEGHTIRIKIGTTTLFRGTIERVDKTHQSLEENKLWIVTCKGPTRLLNRRRPFANYVNQSGDIVVIDLITTFSTGFTVNGVESGLPIISIMFDGTRELTQCLTEIKQMLGATGFVDYEHDIKFFLTEPFEALPPDDIDVNSTTLLNPPALRESGDIGQIRTRTMARGYGTVTLSAVSANESIVPIADAQRFDSAGGKAISQWLRFDYAGTLPGALGTGLAGGKVGTGIRPQSLPSATPEAGQGLASGTYGYAYTWVTDDGETTPSPTIYVTVNASVYGAPNAPNAGNRAPNTSYMIPNYDNDSWGSLGLGNQYRYGLTFAAGLPAQSPTGSYENPCDDFVTFESAMSPASQIVTTEANSIYPSLARSIGVFFPGPDPLPFGLQYRFWRSKNGGSFYLLPCVRRETGTHYTAYQILVDNGAGDTSISDPNDPGYSPGEPRTAPTTSNLYFAKVRVGGILTGPPGTIQRNIYRTDPNGSQLKLHLTLFGNSSSVTDVLDANPNAVGQNVPTVNDSGFVEQTGTIDPGTTSLPVTFVERYPIAGWARIGSMLIRYTGQSGNLLTGIPVNGIGSISSPVRYGDEIENTPALTGVTNLTEALIVNAPVNIWIQKDDLTAQAELALMERDEAGNSTDGIHEFVIVDERIREDTAERWVDTDLAMFGRKIRSFLYDSSDIKSAAGKTVHIDHPGLTSFIGDLVIQEVTITEVDLADGRWPRLTVTASTVRFTFEDLIRRARLL